MLEIPNMLIVVAGECDSGICDRCKRDCQDEAALGVIEDEGEEQIIYCKKCAPDFLHQTITVVGEMLSNLAG
jgi:NAD-dependent SIR2 family protein deacetylase